MTKRSRILWGLIGACGLLLGGITGCDGDDDGDGGIVLDDGGTTDGASEDGGPPDGGPPEGCNVDLAGTVPGSACLRLTECRGDQRCNAEIAGMLSLEGGTHSFVQYPGTMCGDECDANAMTDQCGECGTCSETTRIGRVRIANLEVQGSSLVGLSGGLCRMTCDPAVENRGGCRDGYTCDPDPVILGDGTIEHVCVDACQNDMDCAVSVVDGALALDTDSPWTCDSDTGRCVHPGDAEAGFGDPCADDTECPANGTCLVDPELYPQGICVRFGCAAEGFECADGELCGVVGFGGSSACLSACTVGAEPEADRLGADGNGAGCPDGYSCLATGLQGPDTSPNGVCFPGNYNDIEDYGVGAACQNDSDCYSPFGYGRCLLDTNENVDSGICVVSNCANFMNDAGETVAGIIPAGTDTAPTEVCNSEDGDDVCVSFGDLTTYCMGGCEDASDCAPGYACPEILTGGGRLCWPNCEDDDDCRDGAECEDADGGSCDPATEECFCSDRTPRICGDGNVTAGAEACDDNNDLSCGLCSDDCDTATPLAAATGTITAVSGAMITDGETIDLNDGTNPETTLEFDTGDGVDEGNVAVMFAAEDDAATVAAALVAAINGVVAELAITAAADSGTVNLTNDEVGGAGNEVITTDAANVTVSGMSGGAGRDCEDGTGCTSDDDCESLNCDDDGECAEAEAE